MRYEHRILTLGLFAGAAGTLLSLFLLWQGDYTLQTRVTCAGLVLLAWVGTTFVLRSKVVFPLRTLSNLLGALREGDYSLRVRGACLGDAMGDCLWEVNALTKSLHEQRLGALEATALLRKVLAQIDIAMFGFDDHQRLQLINESGKRLLGGKGKELLGRPAGELGLAPCLEGQTPRVLDMVLPGSSGRWELRRGSYRDRGISHDLVFLSDLTRTLHEEERRAWQRLIRTVRHEVNNSLTPIQSVADSLQALLGRQPLPQDWQEDLQTGLELIAERSEALDRFIGAYSRLMQLPPPRLLPVEVEPLLRRVAGLETRMEIVVVPGPAVQLRADRDQLEQLLINVVSNAVEASLQAAQPGPQTRKDAFGSPMPPAGDQITPAGGSGSPTRTERVGGPGAARGRVSIGWCLKTDRIEIHVDDDGPGVADGTDVFVPFYTTKDHGSGIGLTLSRQIAEAHGGSLTLENHTDGPGCRACLRLPL